MTTTMNSRTRGRSSPSHGAQTAQSVSPEKLLFDPESPRVARFDFKLKDQTAILRALWKHHSISGLIESIVTLRTFWKHEPLIVVSYAGKRIVADGNRRLAAVKLLLSRELQRAIGAEGIPSIDDSLRAEISLLPIVEKSRREASELIAVKQLKPSQEWDSLSKAEYIARIHQRHKISLDQLARGVGDRNETIVRLYHGYCVLQQARAAGVFTPDERWNKRGLFAFSHLWVGLGYTGIQRYLGIKASEKGKPNPVARDRLSRLGKLCLWLYGNETTQPLIRSQNPDLRILDEALRSPRGQAALERGLPLQAAYKASRGDTSLLREGLLAAQQNLREAKGYVTTGYEGQTDIFETAENVEALASSLLDEMRGITKASASRKRE